MDPVRAVTTAHLTRCAPLVAWLRLLEQDGQVSQFPISRTFEDAAIHGYFRSSRFKIVAPHRLVLCVANITIHDRGCGTFTELLSAIEDPVCCFVSEAICIENVFNTRLRDCLLREGFVAHGPTFAPDLVRFRNAPTQRFPEK